MSKIGIGIITYNRKDYLIQCIDSLKANNFGGATEIIIVDDCSTDGTQDYLKLLEDENIFIHLKEENKGVANSKNTALDYLYKLGCEHIFLMEDDILMKHPQTCNAYIEYAKETGIEHLNFALHGDMNTGARFVYWEGEKGITVYPNCVGAFSYYTRNVIEKVGFMDENLLNAWEHVWHTLQIAEAGLTTPFWFFADHPVNNLLLEEIEGSIDNSSIRPRADWEKNIQEGKAYLIQKYGRFLPERPY